jgi:CBS domain-containing protein
MPDADFFSGSQQLQEDQMRVNQIMTKNVVVIAADYSVYDAAEIMLNSNISAAPVVDADGKMIGIVSEADLMHRPEIGTVPGKSWLQRLLADNTVMAKTFIRSHSHRVTDVMTKNVVSADESATVQEIVGLMQRNHVKRIPILRDDKVVGIVSRANILQGLLAREPSSVNDKTDDAALRSAVTATLARQGWASAPTNNVICQEGVIHLWGYVDNDTIKKAYEVAAENVHGVRRVENHMMVIPPEVHFGM